MLVHKIKLVMVMENAYVKMVMKDKIAVYVCMDFTRKGSINFNLYVQVSLLCISLVLSQLKPDLLHWWSTFLETTEVSGNCGYFLFVSMGNNVALRQVEIGITYSIFFHIFLPCYWNLIDLSSYYSFFQLSVSNQSNKSC